MIYALLSQVKAYKRAPEPKHVDIWCELYYRIILELCSAVNAACYQACKRPNISCVPHVQPLCNQLPGFLGAPHRQRIFLLCVWACACACTTSHEPKLCLIERRNGLEVHQYDSMLCRLLDLPVPRSDSGAALRINCNRGVLTSPI